MSQVIVRNCPSPTGLLHIGTLRTALYNYLFAKQHNGKIVFRSEDTDKERSSKEFEEDILSGLKNMGMLEKDVPVVRQSERTDIYKKYLKQLLAEGRAYFCFMTSEELDALREQAEKEKRAFRYPGTFRDFSLEEAQKRLESGEKAVIRLKVPQNEIVKFNDLIRGENVVNTKELDDFVIAKDLETPLYNFCVVIDDHEMGITHVIRGEDHIPNTPKQLLVYEAFGWNPPEFAHLPLILNADKSKLSKRKNKVSVDDFLADGFLPEALLNFLVLLGWNDGTENEIFSLEEMIEKFSLDRVHKGGAVFDMNKLEWINGSYIRKLSTEELAKRVLPIIKNKALLDLIQERGELFFHQSLRLIQEKMKRLSETEESILLFYVPQIPKKESVLNEKMGVDENMVKQALLLSREVLEKIADADWNAEIIKERLVSAIQENGWKNGQLLWPLRVTLSGSEASPSPFDIAHVVGKPESISRIDTVLTKII